MIVGAVDAVKAVCRAIRSLMGAAEPFNHLFEGAVLRGDGIAVGKSDDLCNLESKVFAVFFDKLHGSEGIGAVAVSDKFKVFSQPCSGWQSVGGRC